ncbi:MAG: copper amine oxidase N-terminal domain-containing protein [Clostridia bacterium]
MKKNLIAIIALTAALAASTSAFADTVQISEEELNKPVSTYAPDAMPTPEIQGDIMVLNGEETDVAAPVETASYISVDVTVVKTDSDVDGIIKTTTDVNNKDDQNNTVNLKITDDTLVYDNLGNKKALSDLTDGSKITVFTGSYEPTPLILPVQYTANVIIINGDKEGNVNADTYLADEEGYTNAANTLNIAAADDTKIVDKDEKEYKGDLDKNDLIVFYSVSTKSIPAQTTPTKVVVLGKNEIALKQIEAAKNATPAPTAAPETTVAPEVTEAPQVSYAGLVNVVIGDKNVSDVYAKDNTTMVPLREVAEAAGFTVTWDAENRAVILNDGVYSLKIGENSYVKGKMMPLTLSAAPEIVNDLTYVPAEFFAEVTESATVDGTSLVVIAE